MNQSQSHWRMQPPTASSFVIYNDPIPDPDEYRVFPSSLQVAMIPMDTPGLYYWQQKITPDVGIPGKTTEGVKAHYDAIETDQARQKQFLQANHGTVADQKPLSIVSSFSELMQKTEGNHAKKKRGTPWTVEEHQRFLEGLKTYGKGHWKDISSNVVITRTPAQVASHAQKHFLRHESRLKDIDPEKKRRRRSSIHDITTTTASDTTAVAHEQPPPPPLTSLPDTSNIYGGLSPIRFLGDIDAKLPLTQSPINFYSDQLSVNYFCGLEADDLCIYRNHQKGDAAAPPQMGCDPSLEYFSLDFF